MFTESGRHETVRTGATLSEAALGCLRSDIPNIRDVVATLRNVGLDDLADRYHDAANDLRKADKQYRRALRDGSPLVTFQQADAAYDRARAPFVEVRRQVRAVAAALAR